jgi:putative colanic acid biosynthesis acetyltransferase WcaF
LNVDEKMNEFKLDIENNRSKKNYSKWEYFYRIIWIFGALIFSLTPRVCFGLRRLILRLFGAQIGKSVNIYPSTKIYLPWKLSVDDESSIGENVLIYNLGNIQIGKQTTISHGAHICAGTHDYNDTSLPLLRSKINIGSQVWICADAFVGPNVKIGNGAIVGARSVVIQQVKPMNIVAGNPAKFIKYRNIKASNN